MRMLVPARSLEGVVRHFKFPKQGFSRNDVILFGKWADAFFSYGSMNG